MNPTNDSSPELPDPELVAEWRDLCQRINRFHRWPVGELQKLARGVTRWPTVTGRGQVENRDRDQLFDEIELGIASPIRDFNHKLPGERKNPDLSRPINDAARLHLQIAIDERRRGLGAAAGLPELSKSTAREWAHHCWSNFLETCPNPENDPIFEDYLGRDHTRAIGRKTDPDEVEAAERRSTRSRMKDDFVAAVQRMVRG